MNAYCHWPAPIAAAFAHYDAVRHLDITDPARMAAQDQLWFAQHPDWVVVEADCDCGF
jgi:hypothetical protein